MLPSKLTTPKGRTTDILRTLRSVVWSSQQTHQCSKKGGSRRDISVERHYESVAIISHHTRLGEN